MLQDKACSVDAMRYRHGVMPLLSAASQQRCCTRQDKIFSSTAKVRRLINIQAVVIHGLRMKTAIIIQLLLFVVAQRAGIQEGRRDMIYIIYMPCCRMVRCSQRKIYTLQVIREHGTSVSEGNICRQHAPVAGLLPASRFLSSAIKAYAIRV